MSINQPTLPSEWNEEFAYLFGLLLGDGTLPNFSSKRPPNYKNKYQKRHVICFISNSKQFIERVYNPCFCSVFGLNPNIIKRIRLNRNVIFWSRIESIMIYKFLEKWGFTTGKKARIASVPKTLPDNLSPFLLAGLLDTDGGKKANGFGLSTASEHLAKFCMKVFDQFDIPFHSCPWHKNNHTYHQIYTGRRTMHKILEHIPLRHPDKISFLISYQKHLKKI